VVVVTIFRLVLGAFGRAAPAVGVQAQRPQRSEDERPGGRRGWRNTDPAESGGEVCGCEIVGFRLHVRRRSVRRAGVRLPVIPSPLWMAA